VGQGSCFHFLVKLPRLANAAGAEFQAPEPAPEASDAGRLRVLLAEDNAINQLVASRLIGSFGHEVEVVADGAQAIEAVQRHRYDLVLMDVHMPEVDGLSATRQIRDVERLAGMERHFIVALTAGVMDEEKRRCLDAGMDGFLAKPVVREEVMKVLAQAHATRDSNPGAIEVTMKEYRIRSLPKKL
jgi:CheY-like chemotaxis protein